jgi:hypothetical protein
MLLWARLIEMCASSMNMLRNWGVRVDAAVDPLEDDGLLEALPAQLRRQENFSHAAIRDAPNDVVAAVLRHPERETLPLFTIACPSACAPTVAFVRRRTTRPSANRRGASPTSRQKLDGGVVRDDAVVQDEQQHPQ